jgi:hypothetical protein
MSPAGVRGGSSPIRRVARGSISRMAGGSLRVRVYAGQDPITGRQRWLSQNIAAGPAELEQAEATCRRLVSRVRERRHPRVDVTVAELVDRHLSVMHVGETTRRSYRWTVNKHVGSLLGQLPAQNTDNNRNPHHGRRPGDPQHGPRRRQNRAPPRPRRGSTARDRTPRIPRDVAPLACARARLGPEGAVHPDGSGRGDMRAAVLVDGAQPRRAGVHPVRGWSRSRLEFLDNAGRASVPDSVGAQRRRSGVRPAAQPGTW